MINAFIANILPHMPRSFVWIFSQRYIAGETINDGLRAARELNEKGVLVTVDLLGEYLKNIEEAAQNKEHYLAIIEEFTVGRGSGKLLVEAYYVWFTDRQGGVLQPYQGSGGAGCPKKKFCKN